MRCTVVFTNSGRVLEDSTTTAESSRLSSFGLLTAFCLARALHRSIRDSVGMCSVGGCGEGGAEAVGVIATWS